ncbi:MAG TPA: YtxH domain-containing protein [Lentimicrobium sp.]|nr:YtxH domain-containing protein [Lentimicrobium sp.]
MNAGRMILSIAAGVAAGAIIGVLLAPDKGTETRRKISEKSNEYADGLKTKFNDFIESMMDKFDSVKSEAENLVNKGAQKADEIRSDYNKPGNPNTPKV